MFQTTSILARLGVRTSLVTSANRLSTRSYVSMTAVKPAAFDAVTGKKSGFTGPYCTKGKKY